MAEKKAAVIGSGLGGLAAAIRLQICGFNVTLFEKNQYAGGKAGQLTNNGFRFDTGPSLLTMPFVIEELFEFAGEKLNDYLHIEKLEVLCKYFYPDGTIINAYSDTNRFADEIGRATSDTSSAVINYLNYCKTIYELSAELFLFNKFSSIKTFTNLNALRTLVNIRKLDTGRTMHQANQSFFSDEKTVQLFDRYATYNGSNPYKAPATLNIIPHVEFNIGGYLPRRGIFSISEALKRVAEKKGVQFRFNSAVDEILKEGDAVNGIKVNGEEYFFDFVVSNSDVHNTYKYLLKDEETGSARKYSKLEKSTSALVFYWGIQDTHEELEIHNILFSKNYEEEFIQLFDNRKIPTDPTIYIYISSKFNSDDAPTGCENWFVMINTPHSAGTDGELNIDHIRRTIVDKINRTFKIDIGAKIISENVLTPQKIESRTGSIGGSIYGISSNNKMAAFLRQQNRSKDYKGLYFCGGSAHPGGGIPLVLLSGKLAAESVLEDNK